jgi:pimeloyl-ACP methyl ester carboxylesterase
VRNIIIENAPAVAAQISALNQFPAISFREAEGIIVPALILTGQRSPKWLGQICYHLERYIPQSALSVIPEASHKMHSGNPRAFNEVVLSFLEKNLP